jgi:hypothetical protein
MHIYVWNLAEITTESEPLAGSSAAAANTGTGRVHPRDKRAFSKAR